MHHYLFITVVTIITLFLAQSCKTTQSEAKLSTSISESNALPPQTRKLWNDYVSTLADKNLQDKCSPILVEPKLPNQAQGLAVIYHGFTGCPIQFINMAQELADEGWAVLLPLLPGNGREPVFDQAKIQELEESFGKPASRIVADGDASDLVKDDFSDIPQDTAEYYDYAERMTTIAKSFAGPRVIAGLSLGGGLAVATLIKGAELAESGSPNVWSRSFLVTPFFRAPSIQGNLAPIVGASVPNFGFGFGSNCEAGQLRNDYGKRIGICDFALGNIRTLQALGSQIGRQEQMQKIKVPVQVIGVANDNTSDNTAIINAFSNVSADFANLCFYTDSVGHATFFDGDFVPLKEEASSALSSAKERNSVPRITRYWAREAQDRAVKFITQGFDGNGGPFKLAAEPSTETNPKATACSLTVDIAKVLADNRRLCDEEKAIGDYCAELEELYANSCAAANLERLPDSDPLKAFCLTQQP